jgi:hypothetical protein
MSALMTLASVVVMAAVLGATNIPAIAATTPPGNGPITVVIPEPATPSPSPPGSEQPNDSTGGGSGGGAGGGSVDGAGGSAATTANINADGSPIPPPEPTENAPKLAVDKDRLQANEWIIVSSEGFTQGEKVQVVIYPGAIVVGSFTVDAPTGLSARFRIPQTTLTGLYVLEVTGWQSSYIENAEVTVVSAPLVSSSSAIWSVYVVLGVLFMGLMSLALAFRGEITRWFGASPVSGSTR